MIGEDVKECFECDFKVELNVYLFYVEVVNYCYDMCDYVIRDIFEYIFELEEEYIDWFEMQFFLIDKLGKKNYLQLVMGEEVLQVGFKVLIFGNNC